MMIGHFIPRNKYIKNEEKDAAVMFVSFLIASRLLKYHEVSTKIYPGYRHEFIIKVRYVRKSLRALLILSMERHRKALKNENRYRNERKTDLIILLFQVCSFLISYSLLPNWRFVFRCDQIIKGINNSAKYIPIIPRIA